jgi:hypothetical protein
VRNEDATPDPDLARERITEILRTAMGAPKEEALEDETRRLMLQLSIEPLAPVTHTPQGAHTVPQRRTRLLRRLLGKPDRGSRA